MCTVSYVPKGAGNFILTSNRDENPERITHKPGEETTIVESSTIICPKDSKAGGSWIAMSSQGRVACLLNGAFIKHKHNPPYRKSRGLILMDYFSFSSAEEFRVKTDLEGIENFTLVLVENGMIYELRWDGEKKHFRQVDENSHHLWSSCTLYDAEAAQNKAEKFDHWIHSHAEVSSGEIEHFHGLNNPAGFILERPMVKTVSITSVEKSASDIQMNYHDLLSQHHVQTRIHL